MCEEDSYNDDAKDDAISDEYKSYLEQYSKDDLVNTIINLIDEKTRAPSPDLFNYGDNNDFIKWIFDRDPYGKYDELFQDRDTSIRVRYEDGP